MLPIGSNLCLTTTFSTRTPSCIIIITVILVPFLILGFRVISLVIQYANILKALSDIFEESHLLMERPNLLRGLGPYQSYLFIESMDPPLLSYFLAVSGTPHEISQAIKEIIQ